MNEFKCSYFVHELLLTLRGENSSLILLEGVENNVKRKYITKNEIK